MPDIYGELCDFLTIIGKTATIQILAIPELRMKRILLYIFLVLIVCGFAYLGITTAINKGKQSAIQQAAPTGEQMVGNDRDEHGCIPSAGYTWCEEKQKCLRLFEEPCRSGPSGEEVPTGE